MTIRYESPGRLAVFFDYDADTVARVKALRYASFRKDPNRWIIPEIRLDHFLGYFPAARLVGPEMQDRISLDEELEHIRSLRDAEHPPEMHCELFPYQRVGIKFLRKHRRALLADPAGKGKTRQAIGWAQHFLTSNQVSGSGAIVICPDHIKRQWQAEIEYSLPGSDVQVCEGLTAVPLTGRWCVIGWALIAEVGWQVEISERGFTALVVDEAQAAQACEKSLRGDAALRISRQIPNVLAVTGSPCLHRTQEMEAILMLVGKLADDPNDRFNFKLHFCKGEKVVINAKAVKYYGASEKTRWSFKGASHTDELERFCRPFTLRRIDLQGAPDVFYTYPAAELSNRREYEAIEIELRELRDTLRRCRTDREATTIKGDMLAVRTRLAMACALGKVDFVARFCQERIDDYDPAAPETHGKIVVFSEFLSPLEFLALRLEGRAVKITGEETDRERTDALLRFQTDDRIRVALCSRAAVGVGTDGLQKAADTVVFANLPFGPEDWGQARDRVARTGQTRKVQCVTPLAENSIDIARVAMIYSKAEVIQKLFPHASLEAYEGMLEAAKGTTPELALSR